MGISASVQHAAALANAELYLPRAPNGGFMMLYLITYDLRSPGRNYEQLYVAIKATGGWCHPLDSTWIVATTDTAARVRDRLYQHIDKNDGLLVTRLAGEAAWYGIPTPAGQWLQQQLASAA